MSIEIDFIWVKKCVESSLTETHLHVGEKLVSSFEKKWRKDPEIGFYLPLLEKTHIEKRKELEDYSS
jgi:hypothetical protein